MPKGQYTRRPLTAAQRQAVSTRMKVAWRKRRKLARQTKTAPASASQNGATFTMPHDLARLLAGQPNDYNNPNDYEAVQETARALLRLLLSVEEKPALTPIRTTSRWRLPSHRRTCVLIGSCAIPP